MSWPRLLDLFCGAGGAARGYQLAGLEVVGVDVRPQPRYAGDRFLQADVMEVGLEALLRELGPFEAVHASPPCQAYAKLSRGDHPRLIEPVREQLIAADLPYVIENIEDAKPALRQPVRLCGSMFGLGVQRHRLFEMTVPLLGLLPPCAHGINGRIRAYYGKPGWPAWRPGGANVQAAGRRPLLRGSVEQAKDDMGIDWMTWDELREAIPPAYTEWIGAQLLTAILTANRVNASEPVGTRGDNLPRHLTSARTGGNPWEPVGTSAKLRSPSVAGPAQGPAEFADANSNPPLPLSCELTVGPSGDSHSDSHSRLGVDGAGRC